MKKGIVIPDWVNGADKRSLEYYDGIVIRGTKGKGAEKAAKELGYQCMSGSGSRFIAYKEHDYEPTEVIKKATPKQDGESICKCSRCNTVETVKFAQVDYCFAGELWRYAYTGKPIEPEPYVEDYDNKERPPK